jgi:hypothetical protein
MKIVFPKGKCTTQSAKPKTGKARHKHCTNGRVGAPAKLKTSLVIREIIIIVHSKSLKQVVGGQLLVLVAGKESLDDTLSIKAQRA